MLTIRSTDLHLTINTHARHRVPGYQKGDVLNYGDPKDRKETKGALVSGFGASAPRPTCDRMLVGLSGSIGIYGFVSLLLALKGTLAKEFRVIQTPSAAEMLAPRIVSSMLDCDVWTEPGDQRAGVRVPHFELPEWSDLFVVMPTTANTLASVAHGHAGTLLTLAILTSSHPAGFVPNMNDQMWKAASTQRNVAQIRQDGHLVLEHGSGNSEGYSLGERTLASATDPSAIHKFIVELKALRANLGGQGSQGRAV